MAALFVAGCTHAEEAPRVLSVVRGEVAARSVSGDRIGGVRLAAPVSTTLVANLAPAVVPERGGRRLAYNAWRGDRPVLRLRDGGDRVLAEGAYSPAWRGDGGLAYFQALRPALPRPEAILRYRGHVVVRDRVGAAPVRWTEEPGRYVVAAWAGRRLLAYRITAGWPELLALEGPGRARVLARDAALVAVAPDGGRAFVSTYGAEPPLVRVLDVASGRELARLRVPGVRWIVESGSWRGERVAASASSGIALFRVGDAAVELERVLPLARRGFPAGVYEPQLDDDGRRVTAWGERESTPRQAFPGAAVVQCELEQLRCVRGPDVSTAVGVRLVYDPSRP